MSPAGQERWRSNLGPGTREVVGQEMHHEGGRASGQKRNSNTLSRCAFSLRRWDTGMPCVLLWSRKADSAPANLVAVNESCDAIWMRLAVYRSGHWGVHWWQKKYLCCIIWNHLSSRWKSWEADFVKKCILFTFLPILGTSISEESGVLPEILN